MSSPWALLRLFRRPAALGILLPMFWAITAPIMILMEGGEPVSALWSGTTTEAPHTAVGHLVVLISVVTGMAVAIVRLELQHAVFSWALPGSRAGLLAGTLVIALPLAMALGVLTSRSATAPIAAAFAAFAASIFWFSAAGMAFDVAFPRAARWLVILMLLAAAVQPAEVERLAAHWPVMTASVAVVASALILRFQFSAGAGRIRPFRWSSMAPWQQRLYWAERQQISAGWRTPLATERFRPWLRAAAYESSAGRPVALQLLVTGVVAVLAGYLMNDPSPTLIVAGIFLLQGRMRLVSTLTYPLSRVRRADLAVLGSLIDVTLLVMVMSAFAAALFTAGVPVLGWFAGEVPRAGWPEVLGMAFAWAPIAQWASIRWPEVPSYPQTQMLSRFGMYLPYMLAAGISARLITGREWVEIALAVTLVSIPVWLGYWAAVRRHHARADLVHRAVVGA